MFTAAPVVPPPSPSDALRAALMHSLVAAHRPELADLVASADLALDFPGVWLQPLDPSLSSVWLEGKLLAAATEAGLALAWIHVLAGGRGREV